MNKDILTTFGHQVKELLTQQGAPPEIDGLFIASLFLAILGWGLGVSAQRGDHQRWYAEGEEKAGAIGGLIGVASPWIIYGLTRIF